MGGANASANDTVHQLIAILIILCKVRESAESARVFFSVHSRRTLKRYFITIDTGGSRVFMSLLPHFVPVSPFCDRHTAT